MRDDMDSTGERGANVPVEPGDRLRWSGQMVAVKAVLNNSPTGVDMIVETPERELRQTSMTLAEIAAARTPSNDGAGRPTQGLAALWALWMTWATPRIRSAVLATKPLKPFPHQDEAVFVHMLPQPRLRFLLADEPGTGKTAMTGMYITEGRRRGNVPGKVLVVPPAHLVSKWQNDLRRFFGVDAARITREVARDPHPLRPDIDVWVVSVDLFTHNPDARRKVTGPDASWSLTVFDEAHRLTPTSRYLGAAHQVSERTHHLLLLTATPHRGKEWYFRSLLNLLDPTAYPETDERSAQDSPPLRPGSMNFLRRMKEELVDAEGNRLFTDRFAETVAVNLVGGEYVCYEAVMAYVDEWYDDRSTLARSIYGKRAASSIYAAAETLGRRRQALASSQTGRVPPTSDLDFEQPRSSRFDDDEAWERAEDSVVQHLSRDRRAELAVLDGLLEQLHRWLDTGKAPAKWERVLDRLAAHDITPGPDGGQLLLFTEYTDTARWLVRWFDSAGYSTRILHGETSHDDRDQLQADFLDGKFQVLVSTDAGGEGIDLQSAHVMIDWDIPWSLVRLEQRAGRLHRIGQTNAVFIYHLVAPATREGRVQQKMLENLDAAGSALRGRIFDLLDATVERAGVDFPTLMAEAQVRQDNQLLLERIPSSESLIETAKQLAAEEDRLRSPANVEEAQRRFAQDRLEAVNPVLVEGLVRQLAAAADWSVGPGPADSIFTLSTSRQLPPMLGGGTTQRVAVAASALERARQAGSDVRQVTTLGPTEQAFADLLAWAHECFGQDLRRGFSATDAASLTDYTLFVFSAELDVSDGVRRTLRQLPFLVRYSGGKAFPVAWESVANLLPGTHAASRPEPGVAHEAQRAAQGHVLEEEVREGQRQADWVAKAREDLKEVERRYRRQIRHLDDQRRAEAWEQFTQDKLARLAALDDVGRVTASAVTMEGWIRVRGTARVDALGYDPDSETLAVQAVVDELRREGFDVDDRQTAGMGYDLYAHHPRTREQRLVEVKGQLEELGAVTLESHEWGQAMQRGPEYWLYVVVNCGTDPRVAVRLQDPAGQLGGPTLIERFQIPASRLRPFAQ